jgi:hypothetical protein
MDHAPFIRDNNATFYKGKGNAANLTLDGSTMYGIGVG